MSTSRHDPYKTFRFRLLIDKEVVAALKKVGELKRTTAVVKNRHSDTGIEEKNPGNTDISSITLERGITQSDLFVKWADLVYSTKNPLEQKDFKRDLTLELLNNEGDPVQRYFLRNCWISEFTTIPALDSEANTVAIETIKIELEGYDRDKV